MTFGKECILLRCQRLILRFSICLRKDSIYPEQVRDESGVSRSAYVERDEQGRENCTACGLCALSCPAEAITMKAEERKADEKHLYREENMRRYMKSICCVVFFVVCEEVVRRTLFT
jgi:NADH-quinone oxidoreductase subunit I